MSEKDRDVEEPQFVEVTFPNFYSNTANVANSFMEFAFTFMERLDEKSTLIKARVVMTPVHTKLLLRVLQTQMTSWEQKWGEIKIPEGLVRWKTNDSSIVIEPPP